MTAMMAQIPIVPRLQLENRDVPPPPPPPLVSPVIPPAAQQPTGEMWLLKRLKDRNPIVIRGSTNAKVGKEWLRAVNHRL